jgi:hypothetical protein
MLAGSCVTLTGRMMSKQKLKRKLRRLEKRVRLLEAKLELALQGPTFTSLAQDTPSSPIAQALYRQAVRALRIQRYSKFQLPADGSY